MAGLNGSLDGIISELTDMLGRAEWSREQAQEALNTANAEVQRIKSILKAAGWSDEKKPKAKSKPKGYQRVNEETRDAVLKAIRLHKSYGKSAIDGVPGSFTVSTLEIEGLHTSSVRAAINNLREDGIIRAVGQVPNSPRLAPMAYALTGEYPGEAGE